MGPLEKPQQNFPKSYVQSTHRQEWFDNMALGGDDTTQPTSDDHGAAATTPTAPAVRRGSDTSGSGRETDPETGDGNDEATSSDPTVIPDADSRLSGQATDKEENEPKCGTKRATGMANIDSFPISISISVKGYTHEKRHFIIMRYWSHLNH